MDRSAVSPVLASIERRAIKGMKTSSEFWVLKQLERLAGSQPRRFETVINQLWDACPALCEELALSALCEDMISEEHAAEVLDIEVGEVRERLKTSLENRTDIDLISVHMTDRGRLAKLSETGIPVWEVVHENRKLGSPVLLREAFPALGDRELAAVTKYAERHSEEIESQVRRYEERIAKREAEYPALKVSRP